MKIVTIFAFLIITSIALGQSFKATPAQIDALKKQAEACTGAMMRQDIKTMVYYTYPPVVKNMGGEDKMITKIKSGLEQMQSQGFSFKSVGVGEVKDIVKSKGDLYCLVQDIVQMQMGGSVVTTSSYLLAYSHDNGVRWYFAESAPLKNVNIKQLFPTFPPGMVIPEAARPKF